MPAKPIVGTLVDTGHALYTNLWGSWLFNEGSGTTAANSQGSSGRNITLDLTSIVWGTTTNFTSGAALVCSSNPTVAVGGVFSGPTLSGTWSVEVWFKNGASDTYGSMCSQDGTRGLFLHANRADYYQGTFYDDPTAFSVGSNYQWVLTYDGVSLRYYSNGSLSYTTGLGGASFTPNSIINDNATETFVGTYDLLRVWQSRTLTGPEVSSLFTDPFGMYTASTPSIVIPSLFNAGRCL